MKKSLVLLLSLFLVFSCTSAEKPVSTEAKKSSLIQAEKVFVGEPEPIKTRLDVYNSIARAVKYNVDAAADAMASKLYETKDPKNALKEILSIHAGSSSPLYADMKMLDFAIMYATATLGDERSYMDNSFYLKSSQNLALAAIKSHQDALFAIKKNKEISRIASRENKNLKIMNEKLERVGSLSKEDLAYKKDLEVALLRFNELQQMFAVNIVNHARIIKAESPEKLDLEGRKFYELEDFDRSLNVDVFQKSAFKHRDEFYVAKGISSKYSFEKIQQNMFEKYPETERLKINGFNFESPLSVDGVGKRAESIANRLIDKTVKYARTPVESEDKQILRVEAFDELGLAIFMQIEVAYNLIKVAEVDLQEVNGKVSDIKGEIAGLERAHRDEYDEKAKLLDKKIKLLETEVKVAQILGERALAIRSLYFCAGFSPFTQKFLRSDLKEMVSALKVGFNKDAVEMIAESRKNQTEGEAELVTNDWTKGENWIEKLVEVDEVFGAEGEAVARADTSAAAVSGSAFSSYDGEDFDSKKSMQLGSYAKRENADVEWEMLQRLYPELKGFTPKIEKVRVNGQAYYRMIIISPTGGFKDLCNRLRADRVECLLK